MDARSLHPLNVDLSLFASLLSYSAFEEHSPLPLVHRPAHHPPPPPMRSESGKRAWFPRAFPSFQPPPPHPTGSENHAGLVPALWQWICGEHAANEGVRSRRDSVESSCVRMDQ